MNFETTTTMHIRPILSTLLRHKIAAALIVLEIAITFAIVCNAIFLIAGRIERAQEPSGMAEPELLRIQLAGFGARASAGAVAQTTLDLSVLRALPGVKHATVTNQVPFGNSSTNTAIALPADVDHEVVSVSTYFGGEDFIATTGVKLIAGRDFTAGEYLGAKDAIEREPHAFIPAVILNRATAEKVFPGGQAVGKTIHIYGTLTTVVGVIDELIRPNRRGRPQSMVLPLRATYMTGNYLLRVDPAQRDAVLKAAVAALDLVGPGRVVQAQQRYDTLRDRYFQQDYTMAMLLAAVCAALLVVTALGIVGLASFWVQQRTRMIGTRRALGATRGQILRYFQTENLLLTGIGIGIGMVGAYAINQLLMTHYELARLPLPYLPIGALLLIALGQLAVWVPARRAAALPPVVVMRGA